ncbi:hypothetical protein DFH09DRAFT_1450419 [Mycena vulgaris]|nr:hypothetical protein DFH09DRAFT_1450419 [Mycena vulgaris]
MSGPKTHLLPRQSPSLPEYPMIPASSITGQCAARHMVLDLKSEPPPDHMDDRIDVLARHLERDEITEHLPRSLGKNAPFPLHPPFREAKPCDPVSLPNPFPFPTLQATCLNCVCMLRATQCGTKSVIDTDSKSIMVLLQLRVFRRQFRCVGFQSGDAVQQKSSAMRCNGPASKIKTHLGAFLGHLRRVGLLPCCHGHPGPTGRVESPG